MRYGRSFYPSVREQIPTQLIEQLPQEYQESHTFFMNLRDKWVEHSVNGFEFTQVVAYLTPAERGPKSVSSISVLPNRIAFLSVQDMLRLQKLAKGEDFSCSDAVSCIQYSIGFSPRRCSMSVRLNITMDNDVYARLKKEVPAKKLSAFISEAVRAQLHPDANILDAAYQAARKERWRKVLDEDWKHVDGESWPK